MICSIINPTMRSAFATEYACSYTKTILETLAAKQGVSINKIPPPPVPPSACSVALADFGNKHRTANFVCSATCRTSSLFEDQLLGECVDNILLQVLVVVVDTCLDH
uniref:Uncharacterized protein n=1 Tax=Triticum urartu TaxID=4572 RepID=A0A8R7PDH1_TRIUA